MQVRAIIVLFILMILTKNKIMEENKQTINHNMVTVEVTSSEERKFTGYKDSYDYDIYVGDELCIWTKYVVYKGIVKIVGNKYYYVGDRKYDEEIYWHSIYYPLSSFMGGNYNVANVSNSNVKVEIKSKEENQTLEFLMRLVVFGLFGLVIYLFTTFCKL